jgi:acetyl/propionyl-CoA carboxylase alpha subunit
MSSRAIEQMDVQPGGSRGELLVRQGDRVDRVWAVVGGGKTWVFHQGQVYEIAPGDEAGRARTPLAHGSLTAPMPATVIAIKVKAGDRVKHGDLLIVLEAMKMELPVRSPGEGTVTAVHCREGDLVQPDVSLVELASEDKQREGIE